MTVALHGVGTPVGGTTATIDVAAPAATPEFAQMLMGIFSNLNVNPTEPSGWVFVDGETGGTSNVRIYKRTATGSEPATYTVTRVGAENYCAVILAWTSDSGKDLYVDAHANQANASGTNRVFAGVTTTKASAGLACFANLDTNVGSTADAAMLEKIDQLVGLGNRIYLMTQVLTVAGATGTRTATGTAAATRTVTVAVAERLPPDSDPSSLLATAISTSRIDLTFNQSSSNETGFDVETSTNGSSWSVLTTLGANVTNYSHTGLSEHTRHWYRVRAVNGEGYSGYSNESDTYTLISAPTGLSAAPALSTQVNLSWTNNSGLSPVFKVEQSSNGSTGWAEIASTSAGAVTYSVTGLTPSTLRYWRIRAFVSPDHSTYSSNASATTFAALSTPTGLSASVVNPTTVRLFWTDADVGVTGWKLERADNGGSYVEIYSGVSKTYLDDDVLSENSYQYKVRAYRSGSIEYSSFSSVVSVVMPAVPRANAPSFLFLLNPQTIYSGVIDMGTISYPVDQITYDAPTGTYGNIREGHTIVFGSAPGLTDLGRQRVRSLPGVGTIGIGRSSRGRFDGEISITDNVYFEIWDEFRVWSRLPFINSSGVIFKDSSIAVSDNTLESPPVSNCGPGFADTVDSITDLITVEFTSTSFTTAPGATITDYLWDVADGVVTAGSITTATVTCTFVSGFRWIHLTITDSNGKTHISHAPVYAREEGDGTVRNFQVTEHSIKPSGQSLQFNIREDISAYPDGCLVMLWSGVAASPADRSMIHFIGYHNTDTASIAAQRTGLLRDVTLNCVDVAGCLARLSGYSQLLNHDTTPSTWTEYAYLNMDRYAHYILHWHSTALELADFQWSGTGDTYTTQQRGSHEMNMLAQISEHCEMFVPDYVFTCNRRGQLAIKPDPMIQEVADRTATNQVTLYSFDYSDIQYTHQYFPTISRLNGGAVLTGYGTPTSVFCYAPGVTFGQGVESQTREHGLTPSQTILNQATGHRYARMNSSLDKLRITLAYGDDRNIEPADMTWVTLDLPATVAAQRGLTLSPRRGLVQEMSIRYDYQRTGTVKTIDLVWECETVGLIGQTYTPATVDPIDSGGWVPDEPIDTDEPPHGIASGVQNVAMIDNHGGIMTTADFQSTPPTWAVFEGIVSDPQDDFGSHPFHSMIVDPFSPLYRGTGSTVRAFAVNRTAVWRIDDIFGVDGDPALVLLYTFASGGLPYVKNRTIQASFGRYQESEADNPWLMVVTYYRNGFDESGPYDGVVVNYSTDAGATWSTDSSVSSEHDGPVGFTTTAKYYNGVYLSPKTPGLAYTVGYELEGDPPGGIGHNFVSTDWGKTWTLAANPDITPGSNMAGALHVPYPDNAGEDILYYGNVYFDPDIAAPLEFKLFRSDGASTSDLTPTAISGKTYGPWRYPFGIRTYDSDRSYVAFAGRGNNVDDFDEGSTNNKAAVFYSTDEGVTWIVIVAPMNANVNDVYPDSVAFSGDDPQVLYIWGNEFYVAQTVDGGSTVEDKYGNIGGLGYAGYEEVLLFAGGDA